MNTSSHDVLIAGAGPVGLFLACELAEAGCRVLILEKAAQPQSPFKSLPLGLRGLSVPTLEALDRRDLLTRLRERAPARDGTGAAHWMTQRRRPGGHFAGIQFFEDQIDPSGWPFRLPGEIEPLAADMASVEELLTNRATALGVEIRRDSPVERVEQSERGVVVQAGGTRVDGGWLVGCDGGRSAVRKAAGVAFAGTDPEFTGYSALVTLADPTALRPGRNQTPSGMYIYTPPGTIGMVDFDGGAFHRTRPITREHIEATLARIADAEVQISSLQVATSWTDRAFQATRYRCGRVLLAGDAAHVHSPLGGQGLNLGLGDAMNLGWKLAAVACGAAPDALLDSYERERQPVGAAVLDWSRAQVALMRPAPASRALAAIMRDLIATGDGATYVAGKVRGVDVRYDLGDAHPLVGRSVPDFPLADGGRVNELLRSARGLLLDFTADPALRMLAARWNDRVAYRAAATPNQLGVTAALVRPDGVVAWACDGSAGITGVEAVLSRWFGDGAPAWSAAASSDAARRPTVGR